jgi:hypothetical protein
MPHILLHCRVAHFCYVGNNNNMGYNNHNNSLFGSKIFALFHSVQTVYGRTQSPTHLLHHGYRASFATSKAAGK